MTIYESLFYVGVMMMSGSALAGLLTAVLLKCKRGKLQRLLDSEYGPQVKQQKALRKTEK